MSEFAFLADQDHALSLISETSFAVQVVQEARHFFSREQAGKQFNDKSEGSPEFIVFCYLSYFRGASPCLFLPPRQKSPKIDLASLQLFWLISGEASLANQHTHKVFSLLRSFFSFGQ